MVGTWAWATIVVWNWLISSPLNLGSEGGVCEIKLANSGFSRSRVHSTNASEKHWGLTQEVEAELRCRVPHEGLMLHADGERPCSFMMLRCVPQ